MFISIIEIDHLISYQLCMSWLNWSLKFHSGLRTIPHLVLTHNTQDFDSINVYLICVIVHVQMWCVCSITCWSNPKHIPAESLVSAGICRNTPEWPKSPGTGRILTRGGTKGISVPDYILVREIPAVLAGTEQNS